MCDDTFLSCLCGKEICCFLPKNVFPGLVLWFVRWDFERFGVQDSQSEGARLSILDAHFDFFALQD